MSLAMSQSAADRYQEVQVSPSSPGEVLLAMYDGLFRFLNVARYALRNRQRARAGEAISRSHAIVSELLLALDHSKAPELCQNLHALYDFCLAHLVQANLRSDAAMIEDVIRVLGPVREAFVAAVRAPAPPRAK